MSHSLEVLCEDLHKEALAQGFTQIGICAPDSIPEAAGHLRQFIEDGLHGEMSWMAERMNWRGNPAALWPKAKSVIMLAESYSPENNPLDILELSEHGAISVYAQNRDYHDLVKKRLKHLGRWLVKQMDDVEIKVFVDTAPVMEKPLGASAGLGWQGKHTNLVGRNLGSWFFLGAIFTTIDFPKNVAEIDHCGSCRSCLDICPTNAFIAPYRLDARRCISYLTIEYKGKIDLELRPLLGNRIYGCDDCLAVCPWNKFAKSAQEVGYLAQVKLKSPRLDALLGLNDAEFRVMFRKNPIKRIGRDQFIRNVLYAIGNSGSKALQSDARGFINDENPVIKDAALWAVNEISKGDCR